MNSRQRIRTALSHEPPDRTPTDGWFHPEVVDTLKRHFRTADWSVVLAELGIERRADLSPQVVPPDGADEVVLLPGHASGKPARWLDDRTYEDVWGVRFRTGGDGKLTDLVDDLVEIGIGVLNPVQPECMDPVEVKRCWGDRITLHGCISIQRTLPFGTPADVRREVEELIRRCGYNGGLILMPSNNVQPDTPVENILACYHAARKKINQV